MNRRNFIKGMVAIAALVAAPKFILAPQPQLRLPASPGWSWDYSEEAGRRFDGEIVAPGAFGDSIFYPRLVIVTQPTIWHSGDGQSWRDMDITDVGFFSFSEPSQGWNIYDSDPGLYLG